MPVESSNARSYASSSHVEALNQGRPGFTATSNPTVDQVGQWLLQTAGVIDGLLRERGYVVPVPTTAATSALDTLAGFNAAGAHFLVEAASKTRDKLQYEAAKSMWDTAQKMLGDGIVSLDLPTDTEIAMPRNGFASAATPFFSRDMIL